MTCLILIIVLCCHQWNSYSKKTIQLQTLNACSLVSILLCTFFQTVENLIHYEVVDWIICINSGLGKVLVAVLVGKILERAVISLFV